MQVTSLGRGCFRYPLHRLHHAGGATELRHHTIPDAEDDIGDPVTTPGLTADSLRLHNLAHPGRGEVMDTHLCRNSDIAGRIAHTGEHGIGNGRLEFLEDFLGSRMIQLYKSIKLAFDDKLILNPGKMIEFNK